MTSLRTRSAQLALIAHHTATTTESRSAIIRATSPLPGYRILCGPGPTVLATAADQQVGRFLKREQATYPNRRIAKKPKRSNRPWPNRVSSLLQQLSPSQPTGRRLAHGSAEGHIHLLSTSGKEMSVEIDSASFTFDGPINSLLFSHDTEHLFAASGGGRCGLVGPRRRLWEQTLWDGPDSGKQHCHCQSTTTERLLASANKSGTITLLGPLSNLSKPVWQSSSTHHGPAPAVRLVP